MENLWGDISTDKIETPKSILEDQAKYLSDATRKNVFADIERDIINERVKGGSNLTYNFIIRGKYMDNFGYKLLSISHPIDLYPLKLEVDSKTFEEIKNIITLYVGMPGLNIITIKSQKEYIDVLRCILTSNRVKNLITGVLSLSSKEYTF